MASSSESWLPVIGHEGLYEVSDQGRVRSIPRSDRMGRSVKGGLLSRQTLNGGHLLVRLHRDGVITMKLVHHAVLEAFVGPRPEGMEGCHFPDRDPANNRLENLRWDTRSSNHLDRRAHGTDPNRNKERCPRGHGLLAPNLVGNVMRRGHRGCLACNRAHAYVSRHREASLQAESDRYYAEIMEGVAA